MRTEQAKWIVGPQLHFVMPAGRGSGWFSLAAFLAVPALLAAEPDEVTSAPIAGIFERTHHLNPDAFIPAVEYVNCYEVSESRKLSDRNNHKGCNRILQEYFKVVKAYDSFDASGELCRFMEDVGVAAVLGPSTRTSRDVISRICEHYSIPFLDIMPSHDFSSMSLRLYPDPRNISSMIRELVQYWKWREFLFIYEDSSALEEYAELFRLQALGDVRIFFYQLGDDLVLSASAVKRSGIRQFIVDCRFNTVSKLLNAAQQHQILGRGFQYLFTRLDFHVKNFRDYSYGDAIVNSLRLSSRTSSETLIDNYRTYLQKSGVPREQIDDSLNIHGCLMVDAVHLIERNWEISEPVRKVSCNSAPSAQRSWSGYGLFHKMKQDSFEGLTGHIEFDRYGSRDGFILYLSRLVPGGLFKEAGRWTRSKGLEMEPYAEKPNLKPGVAEIDGDYKDRTLIVTTVIQPPFVIRKNGTNRLEGFCIDLMEKIQQKTQIKYEFRVNPFNQFGVQNESGHWNGMVGDIMTKVADMSMAPLTINYGREMAIDFTKPFMTFGVSILYRRPQKDPPGLLSFLAPISYEVWATVLMALVIVSLSMYVLARFSPVEWENPYPCLEGSYKYKHNIFNIGNAFWFTLGSLMQQGGDVLPKGPSTRLLAVAWWFFTLIIVSSYTANLAAFLAITTTTSVISSAEDLAAQTEIKYGCMTGGSTCDFFKNSDMQTFKSMWNFMESTEGTFVTSHFQGVQRVKQENGKYAYIMESPAIKYEETQDCDLMQVGGLLNSLGYGMGVRPGSVLRDVLTNAILSLNEEQVILELTNKWWKVEGSMCKDKSETTELQVENVGGIFIFLIGGLGVALVFLVAEVIAYTAHHCRQNKNARLSIMRGYFHHSIRGRRPDNGKALGALVVGTNLAGLRADATQQQGRQQKEQTAESVRSPRVDTVVTMNAKGDGSTVEVTGDKAPDPQAPNATSL